MRTVIGATISYGAIVVKVGVASAGVRANVELNGIHTCGTKLRQTFECPECGVTVSQDEQRKGFKIGKDKFLEIDGEEFAELTQEKERNITIDKFVSASDVKPQMVEKRYFLKPDDFPAFVRPYEALLDVLLVNDIVGIGRARLWGVERPVAVEANPVGLLTLAYLFCADEMPPVGDELSKLKGNVEKEEIDLLTRFVAMKTGALEPRDLTSRTKERQLQFIDAQIEGGKLIKLDEAPEPEPTVDMLAKLKEMIG